MNEQAPLEPGLYLVATPIGNLGDITHRAVQTLQRADRVYAEDTRHSRRLLNHLNCDRALIPCHEHNETAMAGEVVRSIEEGQSCALITDAGSPGISDPGFRAVRACRKAGVAVFAVPGANAAIAALSVSGLPTDCFHFFGFLPPKSAARKHHFETHRDQKGTLVYYESTHRIGKFINDAHEVFGANRTICVARELTKQFETVLTGTLAEVKERFASGSSKGEFVVMIAKEGFRL